MARTNTIVEGGLRSDYTSIIVSYSNGIDSTGALYWAIKEFPKERIYLLYCDTGLEYPENIGMFYQTARFLGVKPVLLQHPGGFLNVLLHNRKKWPDMKVRWCTAYLKTQITDQWIRQNRHLLGTKCLFISGERRDESPRRAKLPEIEFHSTSLKTKRVADFECHWYRPCLEYEKGRMFEQGKLLKLDPHPCYEYLNRCSCMICVFMPDQHAIENIMRYPEIIRPYVLAEADIGHRWKQKRSLQELWDECYDIDDIMQTDEAGLNGTKTVI